MSEGLFPFAFTTHALLNLVCLFISGTEEKGFMSSAIA